MTTGTHVRSAFSVRRVRLSTTAADFVTLLHNIRSFFSRKLENDGNSISVKGPFMNSSEDKNGRAAAAIAGIDTSAADFHTVADTSAAEFSAEMSARTRKDTGTDTSDPLARTVADTSMSDSPADSSGAMQAGTDLSGKAPADTGNGTSAEDRLNASAENDGIPKVDLLSLYPDELESLLVALGEPKFRAKQMFSPLQHGISPEKLTTIGKATKEKLSHAAFYRLPTVERKLVSAIDGTVKYLFGLADGNCVEAVVMKYKHGNTVCISSQVGCRMGCRFCASTIGGKVRDLTAGELMGQVLMAQMDTGERIDGIVMMGIGEPLDNYRNVVRFLRLVGQTDGLCIGYRHISLSTCGLVPRIYDLAKENLPITLSISLHAPDDETRSSIMPVNRAYPVDELLRACRDWFLTTGRRISFEYTLIAGKNDSRENAAALAKKLNSALRTDGETMPIHVNLIPVNEVTETGFVRSGRQAVAAFAAVLEKHGIRATVRRKLGSAEAAGKPEEGGN